MNTYIITGGAGHLGSTLIRMITEKGDRVRALIMKGEEPAVYNGNVEYVEGDVCERESIERLFSGVDAAETAAIHTAGIIDISERPSAAVERVNVGGTKLFTEMCVEYGMKKLVYISTVHAIPDNGDNPLTETKDFSAKYVSGAYAETKAEATRIVLEHAEKGLDAVVIHPSAILGPYDRGSNPVVQMIRMYAAGKLPACVKGGYDMVDVRDVAEACLLAAEKGRRGECYIIGTRKYDIAEMLELVRNEIGGKKLVPLPLWVAKLGAPFLKIYADIRKERPLYTSCAIDAVGSAREYSHEKATRELGYAPRDMRETVRDTLEWIMS